MKILIEDSHEATHCNILQTLNTLQHTATHCNTLPHTISQRDLKDNFETLLQHTATHCNTLRRTMGDEDEACDAIQVSITYIVFITYIASQPQSPSQGWRYGYRLMVTGWRRPIECLELLAVFRKRATNYRALLHK